MRLGIRLVATLGLAVGLAALVGCQDDPQRGDRVTVPATVPATAVPTPAGGSLYAPGDIDDGLAPWIADATDDLAARLGTAPDAITTIAAVLVTWPDAALGCPEPDRRYATDATDGAVIELTAGDAVYRYHAGGDRGPFLCPRPLDTAPAPGE